jgi:hypothetical protein
MIGVIQQLTDRPIENPPPRRPIGFVTKFPSTKQLVAKKPQRRQRKR